MTVVSDRSVQQLESLRHVLSELLKGNAFYAPRLKHAGIDGSVASIEEFFERMPFTFKHELIDDQHANPPYGTNLTYDLDQYTRLCQTSGTTGDPMRWLDTAESWQALNDCWLRVYEAAGVTKRDRIFFAFSFGPFLGFWTAFEAGTQLGALSIPGGGMSSKLRLRVMMANEVTVLCCTPTYAIRLAEVAREEGIDLSQSALRRIIVAGEPGGSVPATRRRIESLWQNHAGVRVFDHHGMTEVGPVSYENPAHSGVIHCIERAFAVEIIDPATEQPVQPGEVGELVLTTLHRVATPLLRYRTGDLVRQCMLGEDDLGEPDIALEGGILGRADDMVVVRGVNIYPTAIDQIVRQFDDVAEYRVRVTEDRGMNELAMVIEPAVDCDDANDLATRVAGALRDTLTLRVPVKSVEPGGLPRFEMKAQRWIRS